jgi:3-deoxy-D-manno-octulosonate 8-phosphate phosphatase (KDO 8-P phosphatase)
VDNTVTRDNGKTLEDRARLIRLVLTDCVLTDGTVYCSAQGEELKRFSLRDGMGVERVRKLDKVYRFTPFS